MHLPHTNFAAQNILAICGSATPWIYFHPKFPIFCKHFKRGGYEVIYNMLIYPASIEPGLHANYYYYICNEICMRIKTLEIIYQFGNPILIEIIYYIYDEKFYLHPYISSFLYCMLYYCYIHECRRRNTGLRIDLGQVSTSKFVRLWLICSLHFLGL